MTRKVFHDSLPHSVILILVMSGRRSPFAVHYIFALWSDTCAGAGAYVDVECIQSERKRAFGMRIRIRIRRPATAKNNKPQPFWGARKLCARH